MTAGRTTLRLSVPAETRRRWQAAADRVGYSLAEWLRRTAEHALQAQDPGDWSGGGVR